MKDGMGATVPSQFHDASLSRGVRGAAHKELTYFRECLGRQEDLPTSGLWGPNGHLDLREGIHPSLHVFCMARFGGSASSSGFPVGPQIPRAGFPDDLGWESVSSGIKP